MRARAGASVAVGVPFFLIHAMLMAQAPSNPQGATQPGPPAPRMQMPPRDLAAAEVTGTARIRGRVVAADNGGPLRRAQIRVSAPELRINRGVNTDAEGRYEFAELPAGRYNIFVSRSGYVSLQFGQRRPFESGRPLEVGNGHTVERIDFARADRWASLTLRTQSGGSMSMRGLTMAGLDGRFSVASVPPGEHFIEMSPRPGDDESASVAISAGGQAISDLVITTTPGAMISGQVTFEGGPAPQTPMRVFVTSPDPGGQGPTRIFDSTQGVLDEKGQTSHSICQPPPTRRGLRS